MPLALVRLPLLLGGLPLLLYRRPLRGLLLRRGSSLLLRSLALLLSRPVLLLPVVAVAALILGEHGRRGAQQQRRCGESCVDPAVHRPHAPARFVHPCA